MTVSVDNESRVITVDHPMTTRELYSSLMDLFDDHEQMASPVPMEAVPTAHSFTLVNGWNISDASLPFLQDGGNLKDVVIPPPPPPRPYTPRKIVVRRLL